MDYLKIFVNRIGRKQEKYEQMDKKQTGIVLGVVLIVILLFCKPFVERFTQQKHTDKITKSIILKDKKQAFMIKEGKTKQLKIKPEVKEREKITWESDNEKVASVDEKGMVMANQTGSCNISCYTQKKYKDTVQIIVLDKETFIYKNGFSMQVISSEIKNRISGKSYKKNPNIQYSDLRYLSMAYYNFNGQVEIGEMIVNKEIAKDVLKIFYQLYKMKYPIEKMKLIDEYEADDTASMEDNNTSCFNYREVAGSEHLSKHAYGCAIDINPRINPYINNKGQLSPKNGKKYKVRDIGKCKGKYKKYMIQKNDEIYKLFLRHGFTWGGDWYTMKDYQHFQKPVQ